MTRLSGLFIVVLSVLALMTMLRLGTVTVAAGTSGEGNEPLHERSHIALDLSSLEALYLHPELVLANVDSFYTNDRAYWLSTLWLKDVGYGYPPQGWLEFVQRLAASPETERETAGAVALGRECAAIADSLSDDVIAHIASFLPDSVKDLSSTVYLTGLIVPNAFQKDFQVVINANAFTSPADVWNTIVHELFHVGYYRNECHRTEMLFHSIERHDLIYSLQNEGMATYVAMTAPSGLWHDVEDYQRVSDDSTVADAIGKMNGLIRDVDVLPADSFRQKMFDVGVQERVLYVCGAHIAQVIDRRLGREALVTTVAAGPRTFISTYNDLVPEDQRVIELPLEEPPSSHQILWKAVVDADYILLRKALRDTQLDSLSRNPPPHALYMTGQLLLARDSLDLAIDVFEVLRDLFPGSGNPYEGLAEAHLEKGDTSIAVEYFEKLAEIAPGNARAEEMLKELKPRDEKQ